MSGLIKGPERLWACHALWLCHHSTGGLGPETPGARHQESKRGFSQQAKGRVVICPGGTGSGSLPISTPGPSAAPAAVTSLGLRGLSEWSQEQAHELEQGLQRR